MILIAWIDTQPEASAYRAIGKLAVTQRPWENLGLGIAAPCRRISTLSQTLWDQMRRQCLLRRSNRHSARPREHEPLNLSHIADLASASLHGLFPDAEAVVLGMADDRCATVRPRCTKY
jgi:hypothetical protein